MNEGRNIYLKSKENITVHNKSQLFYVEVRRKINTW